MRESMLSSMSMWAPETAGAAAEASISVMGWHVSARSGEALGVFSPAVSTSREVGGGTMKLRLSISFNKRGLSLGGVEK